MSAAPLPLNPETDVDEHRTLIDRIRAGLRRKAATAKFRRAVGDSAALRLSKIEQKVHDLDAEEEIS